MFTLTLTQRAGDQDRVPELLGALESVPIGEAGHPFRRTFGSQAVGVVDSPEAAVDASLKAVRFGSGADGRGKRIWAVGIGVGPVVPDGEALAGAGPSRSRRASESALRATIPVCVEGGPAGVTFDGVPPAPESAGAAQGVLRLLGDLVASRSKADWEVVDLVVPGVRGQQKAIADALGITVQAVSQTLIRARQNQETEGRSAAALMLRLAAFAVD
ncbi:hypothetical protein [Galactobacter sp.]|uniref:hypothetical protein n=1 Tax=Galactobacter sp. TaxID=2676125 RepID=UPI0025C65B07|nr:hypothetical protein [Galactobacter sp.]